jgi:hypothetical protein
MRRLEAGARLGLAGWAMVITMARTVRYPNDFAEAHRLLDYRFGFIKRGLAGSALTLVTWTGLARPTADTVAALSFAVFGLLAIALLAITARLLNTDGRHSTSFAAAAVFATSPFVVMTARVMGYMDHLVLLAAFGAAWLALRGRAWPAGVIAALGVLVHESFLLVGFPLVLLASHLGPARPRGPASRFLPFLLPLAAAGALGMAEVLVLDPATLRQQLVARLTAFPFVERDISIFRPEWLTTSALSNLRSQAHAFWRHLADVNLLRLMLPPSAFIILVASASAPSGARARRAILANILGHSPLMDGEVERFSAAMRLFLYAPFIAGAALTIGEGIRGPRAGPS